MVTDPDPFNPAHRLDRMIEAAKRWIKFDLPNDVKLGMVTFGDWDYVQILQEMTIVNDNNKDTLIARLDEIKSKGQTCIGCGLAMAANNPKLLNNKNGGNILLISDGKQQCGGLASDCTTVSQMIDVLVDRNIRVVTIAMGPDADPEIEEMAEKTGGKSYYVEVRYLHIDLNLI